MTLPIVHDGQNEFATIPALKYGSKFEIAPDHAGPISLVAGTISKIPGRILQAGKDLYLVAKREDGGVDYVLFGVVNFCRSQAVLGRCTAIGRLLTNKFCKTANPKSF